MPTRIYIQSELFPDLKFIEMNDDATIDELKHAALALLPAGIDLTDLKLSFEDDEDDAHHGATHVKHLKKEHGIHLHLHRCLVVEVQVRYGGQVVRRKFRPAATIGRVRLWAGESVGMSPGDIAEHVLQIAGTTEQPDVDIHIGTLAKCPHCSATFDLVPAHRING